MKTNKLNHPLFVLYPRERRDEMTEEPNLQFVGISRTENLKDIYSVPLGIPEGYEISNFTAMTDYVPTHIIKDDTLLTYEIIFDSAGNRIGYKQIKSSTIKAKIDPATDEKIWIQYKGQKEERILTDSQILRMDVI